MRPNQMQQAILRGQAPAGVEHVDKGNPNLFEQPQVHLTGGAALNQNGTWKHGKVNLTDEQKQWLTFCGWNPPTE